jgi:DNA topoisomerase-1
MEYIEKKYGSEYSLDKPRGFRTKSKSAQEAHEAIRPTYLNGLEKIKSVKGLTSNHKKLYQLIFLRALATQMKEAQAKISKVYIKGSSGYDFQSENQLITFDGFLKILNPTFVERNQNKITVKKGDSITLEKIDSNEKDTNPPPRYTEGSLIKLLEEKGIGRPSTYAPIISLIQTRGYVGKDGGYLIPSGLGIGISDYLSSKFKSIFEIDYTAQMEEELDKIATGESKVLEVLKDFYEPFKIDLEKTKLDKTNLEINEKSEKECPECGKPMNIRFSKYGKFLACSGYPNCKHTESIKNYVKNKKCSECGGGVVTKYSKKGLRFFGCENFPKCKFTEFAFAKLKNA